MREDEAFLITDRIAEYAAELRGKYDEPGARELAWADAIRLAIAVVHDDYIALYAGDPDFADFDGIETVVL